MSNSLDPDQDRRSVSPDLGQTVCKGYRCRLLTGKLTFTKNSFRNIIIRVSNNLDPDQDLHSVGPDLDTNCLQRLSADEKSQP